MGMFNDITWEAKLPDPIKTREMECYQSKDRRLGELMMNHYKITKNGILFKSEWDLVPDGYYTVKHANGVNKYPKTKAVNKRWVKVLYTGEFEFTGYGKDDQGNSARRDYVASFKKGKLVRVWIDKEKTEAWNKILKRIGKPLRGITAIGQAPVSRQNRKVEKKRGK